ncbi:hypothetical protein Tco_0712174 [Tanacetum coccineum]
MEAEERHKAIQVLHLEPAATLTLLLLLDIEKIQLTLSVFLDLRNPQSFSPNDPPNLQAKALCQSSSESNLAAKRQRVDIPIAKITRKFLILTIHTNSSESRLSSLFYNSP